MEGPRAAAASDMDSLSRLVDIVFTGEETGSMFAMFPQFLCEANRENLLIFSDDGQVVSHVGMAERWACIGGCTIGTGCIGAVATYDKYRGQGLATRLLDAACAKASADGMDIMMISGGRGLYKRAGAAEVGLDVPACATGPIARRLVQTACSVERFTEDGLGDCIRAYGRREARFIRPLEDWRLFLKSGYCRCRKAALYVVRYGGVFAGYAVAAHHPDTNHLEICEMAGDPIAMAGALWPLMERHGANYVELYLQRDDTALRTRLERAGASFGPVHNIGTLLLLDFGRLMQRLTPYFETRIGRGEAGRLRFEQDGESYVFAHAEDRCEVEGKAEAARLVFGHPDNEPLDGMLGRVFPVPTLAYGLNYV